MTTGRVFTSGTGGGAPSLLDYLHVLSRHKWTFLATFLLVPFVAVVLSLRQTPVYEATADVLLKPPVASEELPTWMPGASRPSRKFQHNE